MKASRAVCAFVFMQGAAAAQTASPPQFVGHLAGPGAPQAQPGLRLYGTDGGWTFEHRGQNIILFGDTWPDSNLPCEVPPMNDDAQGTLPLRNPGGVPPLFFQTKASSPQDFDPIQIIRGTTSLPMGFGKLPGTGFSDGRNAIAVIGTADLNRCGSDGSCPDGSQAVCSQEVGDCTPQIGSIGLPCDLATGFGCFPGQTCTLTTGYCVDRTSSQSDGTQATDVFAITQNVDFGVQRPTAPVIYDSAERFATNKFLNPTSRTVRRFTFTSHANDYRMGNNTVLVWGRPGFSGEQGRQDQLYLMVLELPIPTDSSGQFCFHPKYFAGIHPVTHEPKWSSLQSDAKPLAMDGVVNGSPHEDRTLPNQSTMAYLPAPINKWMMVYGGDVPDQLLFDPTNTRNIPFAGSIMVRFANDPWGPWSPDKPLLSPGDPSKVGDPYGPGGFLFHYACFDQPGAQCARSDPHRPLDVLNPECGPPPFPFDIGRLYGSNIIDSYTKPDGVGGVDVFFNVSTWNPYGVVLMKTNVRP
jgi:hypothetical protein